VSPAYEQSTTYAGCDDINDDSLLDLDNFLEGYFEGDTEDGRSSVEEDLDGIYGGGGQNGDADAQTIDDLSDIIASVEDEQTMTPPIQAVPASTITPFQAVPASFNSFSNLAAMIPVISRIPMVSYLPMAVVSPQGHGATQATGQAPPGNCSKAQRKIKIDRWLIKRGKRVWGKATSTVRSKAAAKRIRTGGGKFVKSSTKWV
jgi:hypothetical protein